MSAVKQGAGMSKAAQRKRKSLNKSLFASSVAGAVQSDDEIDESPRKVKKTHKSKSSEETESNNYSKNDEVDSIDLTDVTISNILDMKEIIDINSKDRASLLLRKMLSPTTLSDFYGSMWEQRPVYVEHNKKYFADLINWNEVEELFSNHLLLESEDIGFSDSRGLLDVNNQPKDEEELEGDADETKDKDEVNYEMIKSKLARSQTVLFLTPQKYHDGVWRLLSALEHEFNCMVGANVVLAPPNSTSNPKQYDSSDNFILQLRGSSEWLLWAPAKGHELPRTPGNASSGNGDGDDGETIAKKADEKANYTHTLNAGDALYLPKGWLYVQSNSDSKVRSMTLKIFTNQGHAAADLLDVLLPQAIHEAAQSHVAFRRSLPRDLRSFWGVIVSEDEAVSGRREAFQQQMKRLLETMVEVAVDVLDPAADQLTKKMLAERLPVPLTAEEEQCTSSGLPNVEIHDYTKLRMVRPGIASVFVEDGKCVVYHCMHNSRELFGNPLQPLEFELDDGPTLEGLLRAYPEGVTVSDLEHPSEELEDKIGVAQALFREGFLMIDDEFTKTVLGINTSGVERGKNDEDDDEDSIF